METSYKSCPYCGGRILEKPILERHQGRVSFICPHCKSHRSEWVNTEEEAKLSWNSYLRYKKDIYIFTFKPKLLT